MEEELPEYYVLDKPQFADLGAEGEVATFVLSEMLDDDSVMLARVDTEDGALAYLPILLIRDEGATALVNMTWLEDSQKDGLYHCLERLDTFTKLAYETLGQPYPRELKDRRRRLESALYSNPWWTPEEFDELDDSLYQLEVITSDMQGGEEGDGAGAYHELWEALDLAQTNFHVIRAVLYDEEDGEDGEE